MLASKQNVYIHSYYLAVCGRVCCFQQNVFYASTCFPDSSNEKEGQTERERERDEGKERDREEGRLKGKEKEGDKSHRE